jgi:hypothetical protein
MLSKLDAVILEHEGHDIALIREQERRYRQRQAQIKLERWAAEQRERERRGVSSFSRWNRNYLVEHKAIPGWQSMPEAEVERLEQERDRLRERLQRTALSAYPWRRWSIQDRIETITSQLEGEERQRRLQLKKANVVKQEACHGRG